MIKLIIEFLLDVEYDLLVKRLEPLEEIELYLSEWLTEYMDEFVE